MINPYFETKLGKLYLGDSFKILPELKLTANGLILADPMYGDQTVRTQRAKENERREKRLHGCKLKEKNWDFSCENVSIDPSYLLKFSQTIIWGGNYIADRLPVSRCWIVWDKRCGGTSDNHNDCELAWTNLGGVCRIYHHLWRGICRDGLENCYFGPKRHPFQKPVELFAFCINQFKLTQDSVVIDPFGGSGTTAVVCEQKKIKWVLIEKQVNYCEETKNRIIESRQLGLLSDKG